MDSTRWPEIKDHFSEALSLSAEERRPFLDALDDLTRSEVEALLAAAESDLGLLDLPLDTGLLGLGVERLKEAAPPAPVDPDQLLDVRVGPYRIEGHLGRGGMGEVYRARRDDGLFDRSVAIKVVRGDSEAVLERFAAERRILGTLEHPGIARLIAAGSMNEGPMAGRPWLALELVDGVPLIEATADLELADRLRLLVEVAEAVHHAHRRLVVHRDLKPSNVLVTAGEDGTRAVKLLDFGIAKIVDPETDLALTQLDGHTPRTRAYAAPEQISGDPITTATDVYGLGLLLFEVLTGTRPFPTDQGVRALEAAILNDAPPLASTATRPEAGGLDPKPLRGDLDTICRTALAKEPEVRYASAEAFAADLQRYLNQEPIEARAPSVRYRARQFARRHRAGVAAAALVVVSLIAGLGVALWQAREADVARTEAIEALGQSETARARAEAVTDFLQSLFTPNDPSIAGGDTLTTMDLMARGVERAEAMAEQPEVQAQVFLTIGTTYSRLDRYDEADSLLRRALALRRAILPPDDPDVAAAMHSLAENLLDQYGTVDRDQERLDEAVMLLRDALAIRRERLGPVHLDIVASLDGLASALTWAGSLSEESFDEAEALLREGRAMMDQLPDVSGEDRAYLLNSLTDGLAMVLWRQAEYAAAEPVMREALARYRQTYGEEHRYTVEATTNLGLTLMQLARYDEAEPLLLSGLEMNRRLLGDDHPSIGGDLGNLASFYHKKGDLDTAEGYYRELFDRYRRTLGADNVNVGHVLFAWSALHRERGDYADAEATLFETLAIFRSVYPESHAFMDRLKGAFVTLYTAWGKPEEAARYEAAATL